MTNRSGNEKKRMGPKAPSTEQDGAEGPVDGAISSTSKASSESEGRVGLEIRFRVYRGELGIDEWEG